MTSRSARTLAVLATAAASALGVGAAVPALAAPAPAGTVSLPNTLPRWLHSAPLAAPALRARAAAPTTVRVYLAPKGGLAALQARVAAVSDPASPQYRRFLSTAAYDAAYAPTRAQVSAVSAYLRSQGLRVDGVEGHRRYVTASGDSAALGRAFGTQLQAYVHDGRPVTAPSRPVTLPTTVAAEVLTVTGLDTTPQVKRHTGVAADDRVGALAPAAVPGAAPGIAVPDTVAPGLQVPPPAGFRNARPCNINYGRLRATPPLPAFQGTSLPYAPCGYTGPQFRSAYEGDTALTGAGVTVAITDAYAWPLITQDTGRYAVQNGDGAYAPGQLTQNLPSSYRREKECDPTGWSGEEVLDVEAVHAMAPDANVRYYGSRSCLDDDFQDTLARVVDENLAKVVTNSWSDVEESASSASVAAYEQVFLQGALQGQSFFFSSGDNGDELARTGVRQVDYPASDPYVTAAGGTATAISATAISRGTITGQTGWGTQNYALAADGRTWVPKGYLYGAGGGFSALFNRPAYQDARVPASSPAGRAVPDVSMDADPQTGMLVGQTQAFPEGVHYDEYRIGGTSLASPLLAGMTALALQDHAKGGLGLLNPLFYGNAGIVTDVVAGGIKDKGVVRANYVNGVDTKGGVSYFVRTFHQNSSLQTTKGWDTTTGLGVPAPAFLTVK